jgi:gliding motility-associated-like protein
MWVRVFNMDVIDIFVPKTFTPNNDGRNDKIFPYLTPGIKVFNYFKIYNRFGNILFESRDYSMGWDGRVIGVEQPIGIYFWEVNYVNANGNKESKYGQFLLSR